MNEAEWLLALDALPIWDPPTKPMLIIAPHPDDETLGAGGLIVAQRNRGVDVSVAAVTDGERAYAGEPDLADRRREEQTLALARLGVRREKIIRFRLPDSDVASREEELAERFRELVSDDTHMVAPWPGDFHPDHEACGRAAGLVAKRTGAALTYYFFWTWHHGSFATIRDLSLRAFPLDDDLLQAKTEALGCHGSQLRRDDGEPILPEPLLAPARRRFETFALS